MYDFLNIKHSLVLIYLNSIENWAAVSLISYQAIQEKVSLPGSFLAYDAQWSYGKPLSRVAARCGAPSGAYGSLAGAAAASEKLVEEPTEADTEEISEADKKEWENMELQRDIAFKIMYFFIVFIIATFGTFRPCGSSEVQVVTQGCPVKFAGIVQVPGTIKVGL